MATLVCLEASWGVPSPLADPVLQFRQGGGRLLGGNSQPGMRAANSLGNISDSRNFRPYVSSLPTVLFVRHQVRLQWPSGQVSSHLPPRVSSHPQKPPPTTTTLSPLPTQLNHFHPAPPCHPDQRQRQSGTWCSMVWYQTGAIPYNPTGTRSSRPHPPKSRQLGGASGSPTATASGGRSIQMTPLTYWKNVRMETCWSGGVGTASPPERTL